MTRKKDKKPIASLHAEWRKLDEISGGDHSLDLIMDAARAGDHDFLQFLAQKIGINYTENGKTALFWLAGEADLVAAERLILAGAKLNAAEKGAATPLMHAAYRNQLDMLRLLVEKGAQVDYHDANGDSALSFAQEQGHQEALEYLQSVLALKK